MSSSKAFTLSSHVHVTVTITFREVWHWRDPLFLWFGLSFIRYCDRSTVNWDAPTPVLSSTVQHRCGVGIRAILFRDFIEVLGDIQDFEIFNVHGTMNQRLNFVWYYYCIALIKVHLNSDSQSNAVLKCT